MSVFGKGDFKTREEWLKRQRRQIMKRQSLKYHEYNKQIHPNAKQQTNNYRNQKTEKKQTLKDILETEHTEAEPCSSLGLPYKPIPFVKNQKDDELYQAMRQRLIAQESIAKKQRSQIKDYESEIQSIKCQNAFLKGAKQIEADIYSRKKKAQAQNQILLSQFQEMAKYLNQHGAFWQNNRIVGQINIGKIKQDIKMAKTEYRTPNQFQFQTITKRIQELNQSLFQQFGSRKFAMASGVHRLCDVQIIEVAFYRDGVRFSSVGFYLYSSKEGLRILSDLTDGYYPYVLKAKHPEGVHLKIYPRLNEEFKDGEGKDSDGDKNWFKGQGYSLQ